MMLVVVFSLSLLWSLVEVNSQTFPYVSFMGQTLANHAYVNFNLIGKTETDSVQCHTDLTTCCNNTQGIHRGDWYFPNGNQLPFGGGSDDIHQHRDSKRVDLRRRSATSPSGMYHCDIPTVEVHDNTTTQLTRSRIYVGLYANGGDVSIPGGVTLTVDFDGSSPQFTLTCISTGGPATTTIWTRNSTLTVTEGNETVLVNATKAEYIHTLNVTGRMEGKYTCTVANNKPSNVSASRELPGQPIIFLVGKSPNSLNFTWNVSNTTDANTYMFKWQKTGCLAANRDNNGSITTNDTSYIITGLEKGSRYNITVTAGGLSNTVSAVTTLRAPSAAPDVTKTFATSYSITINWELVPCEHRNGDITGYSVRYGEMGTNQTHTTVLNITEASVTEATISNLMLSTTYSFKVAAVNRAGTGVFSNATLAKTVEKSVHITFRQRVIPNNSYVILDDIGHTDDTALVCHTDYIPIPPDETSGGDWFAPNGTRVGGDNGPGDLGFVRNRGPHVVRLKRSNASTRLQGTYRCVIQDHTRKNLTVYVGLINETITSSTFSSSNAAGNSIISTSFIIMYSDMNVSTAFSGTSHGTTSTTANSTITERSTFSRIPPTQNIVYTSPAPTFSTFSSGRMFSGPTPTQSISSMRISSKPTLTPADPTLFDVDKPSNVFPVVGSVFVSLLILLLILTLLLLLIRWSISKSSRPRPSNINYEVRGKGQERMEMNETAEALKEDDQSDMVTPTSDIPAAEFPDYVRLMHQDRDRTLDLEYKSLDRLSQPASWVARLYYNADHNRFKNIFPYDYNRVPLKEDPDVEGSDYINASFIDGYPDKKRVYIASQGPTELTVGRFWEMIWEYQVPTIVMLTHCVESARVKCQQYWPGKTNTTETIGSKFDITVTSFLPYAEYEIRKIQLRSTSEPAERGLTVTHMFYTAWPDHGVPHNTMSLISFLRRVRKVHPASLTTPLLVHCSAGIGRTGTFILLDLALQQMRSEGTVSIFHHLQSMRNQRMKMVQTLAQYVFLHDSLSELVMCGETEVAAANFRINMIKLQKPLAGDSSGFQKQFETLEKVSSQYQTSYQEGLAEYNTHKNRFPDKIPNELGRVRLRCGPKPGSDYINASFIDGYKLRRAYIATQGPLSETVDDMWRMIWENDCKCIVMLCQTMEEGLESSHCFWPPTVGEEKVYGNIRVWLNKESVHRGITERRLAVEGGIGEVTRMVTLLQLTNWPPGHLPHPKYILSLVELLSKAQRSCSSRHTTVICSDGVGRTGTFICLHSQLERLKTEGVVDFLQAVKSARIQRPGLVPDAAHYAFCHEVVAAYVDSFETYANFKEVM